MGKKHSEFFRLILFIISGIYLLIIVLVIISRNDWKSNLNNSNLTWDFVVTWENTIENFTGNISWDVDQSVDIKSQIIETLIINSCNVSWMNSVSLASENNRFYTTEPPKVPIKTIKTNWNLWNVFLCITPDISDKKNSYNDYRKTYSYNAVTFIKIWEYEWFYDVWYSLESNLFYDLDSNNSVKVSKNIKWKYWTHELPLLQLIDVSENIFLADIIYWWTKQVNLKSEFKDGKIINVWAYMTKLWKDAYWASSIKEFKIVRDWNWYIEILN